MGRNNEFIGVQEAIQKKKYIITFLARARWHAKEPFGSRIGAPIIHLMLRVYAWKCVSPLTSAHLQSGLNREDTFLCNVGKFSFIRPPIFRFAFD